MYENSTGKLPLSLSPHMHLDLPPFILPFLLLLSLFLFLLFFKIDPALRVLHKTDSEKEFDATLLNSRFSNNDLYTPRRDSGFQLERRAYGIPSLSTSLSTSWMIKFPAIFFFFFFFF